MQTKMDTQEMRDTFFIEQRDQELIGSTAAVHYDIHFDRAVQHLLRIEMTVENPGAVIELCLPTWTPGSYKLREYSAQLGNLHITDENGRPLPKQWASKNQLRVTSKNCAALKVSYLYYAFERTVRTSHVNRFHAFIMPGTCLLYAAGRTQEVHHVTLHHDRQAWPQVSTPLSPVNPDAAEDAPLLLAAANYDCLVDSPLEMGDHYVASFESHGAVNEIAIAGVGNFDNEWLVERMRTIIDTEAKMFGGVPYDRYVFILQMYPDIFGGLEHARCSVNAFDTNLADDKKSTLRLLELLVHEYFHLWNIKRIRPLLLGPFDYLNEVYTDMLWLAEGVTSYYDDLLTFRCGFRTEKEFMTSFAEQHLWRELSGPGRDQMNVKDSSFLAWVKLYHSNGDSHNRFPSYYTRGAVIFFMLDLHIIVESNGKYTLDDGMRALWQAYQARPEQGITQAEFNQLLQEATGVDISAKLEEWLSSTGDLPYAAYLEKLGMRWTEKSEEERPNFTEEIGPMPKAKKVFSGLNVHVKNGRLLVQRVTDNTPAAEAGLGIDDEIISVNGRRVSSDSDLNLAFYASDTVSDAISIAQIVAVCDGQTYETTLQPIVRPEWTIEICDDAGEEETRLRNIFFGRGTD
jgi:predicted metalloprotease with PDZ domain